MPSLWPRLGQKRQLVPFGFQVQVQGMRTRDTARLSRPARNLREVRPFSHGESHYLVLQVPPPNHSALITIEEPAILAGFFISTPVTSARSRTSTVLDLPLDQNADLAGRTRKRLASDLRIDGTFDRQDTSMPCMLIHGAVFGWPPAQQSFQRLKRRLYRYRLTGGADCDKHRRVKIPSVFQA